MKEKPAIYKVLESLAARPHQNAHELAKSTGLDGDSVSTALFAGRKQSFIRMSGVVDDQYVFDVSGFGKYAMLMREAQQAGGISPLIQSAIDALLSERQ